MLALLRAAVVLLLASGLAACGGSSTPMAEVGGRPAESCAKESVEELLARANAALQAEQLFDPPDNNALALFLEVAERDADADPAKRRRLLESVSSGDPQQQARLAMNDLFPYGLSRVEQALRNGELVDARRILDMLERAQPGASSVKRLRTTYEAAAKSAKTALRSTDIDSLPALISKSPPRYPPRAERRGIEGWVHLSYAIQPDGSVTDVKVMAAEPHDVFDREATTALARWRYKPPGRVIRAQRRIEFELLGEDE